MRLVRGDIRAEICEPVCAAILRDVLLSEMADVSEGYTGARAFAGGCSEARSQTSSMACIGQSGGACGVGAHNCIEPVNAARGSGKNIGYASGDEPRTIRAWGQWSRDDVCASIDDGCSWVGMGSGISVVTGSEKARIPDMLQSRLRKSEIASRNRGGWYDAQQPNDADEGQKTRRDDKFSRVDGIEILEPTDHRLDELRNAAGKLYFYDLGATRHPSYSVNGNLVHNSSILKSTDGHYRTKLIEACQSIPFRLAATATPAPNDFMELGNHAEFLGVMKYTDMLATFFAHDGGDTQKWRIKGHAENEFWKWMASWAVMLRKPSDLGYPNDGYDLPPLHFVEHRVMVD
jgi:hypothetical protein